tara:strand:- start:197 stop:535 length:339 start_codon:yes stop_codon:yes gene_type:complete
VVKKTQVEWMIIDVTKMEVVMFASYIEMKIRPGQMDAMKAHTESIKGQIQDLGMEQFLVLDKGDDSCVVVVVYKTAAEQEANGPKAAQILGGYAEFVAAPPERKQVEVIFNF